jgi:hypothetical protein
MFLKVLAATAVALAIAQPASAGQSGGFGESAVGRDTAIQACLDYNEYAPAQLVEAVDDGLGDFLVWVEDVDGDLWMCNANAEGYIYANIMMIGDLLEGEGPQMIGFTPTSTSGTRERPSFGGGDGGGQSGGVSADPASQAEALCLAVGATVENVYLVATVEDGLGDYLVWLENDNGELWMCNASGELELYAFEPVDYPINDAVSEEEYCTDDDRVA